MSATGVSVLRVNGIGKSYAAPVLRDIDLALGPGELVALTGENGAGKSTLSRIIAGLAPADTGAMQLGAEPYAPASRAAAEARGVRMVLQELNLVPTLSVAENLLLERLPSRLGFVRRAELRERAREALARVGLEEINPDLPVAALGIGQQQLLEVARGLSGPVRVLILDEPTAMLTAPEVERLFGQIAALQQRGVGVLYISHRLDELRRIADRIVVLRDGRLVEDRPAAQFAHDDIVRAMVGGESAALEERGPRAGGAETLRVTGLTRGGAVRDVTFSAHAGEVLGVAGLVGAGRTELLRLLYGADAADRGELRWRGARVEVDSPMQAVRLGMGLVPEDRKSQGLFLPLDVEANVSMSSLQRFGRFGWLDRGRARAACAGFIRRLRLRAHGADQPVAQLSGGNQQKALLARWLLRDCELLLLDEPTRGVDVGARQDIYAEIDALAAQGKTVVMVSSDLRELMLLCDRIAVMSAGQMMGIFERGTWTEELLLDAAFAGYDAPRRRSA